jgi:4-amino-4-deoxy-L-arabinose transferase-like glycosyltransferase
MSDFGDLFAGTVACLLFLGIGQPLLRATTHRATLPLQCRLFAAALFARFATSVMIYQLGFASVLGDADAIGWGYGDTLRTQWDASGSGILDVLLAWRGAFQFTSDGGLGYSTHLGYYYFLGTIFFVIGESSRMVAAALNCFVGALMVVFAYRTARTLFSEWVAVRVGWWACLFPSMIIWCAQTVKEPVVILLEVIALYGCIRLKKSGFAVRYVLLCGTAVALVMPFRFYAAYIGLAAVAVALVAPSGRRLTRGSAAGLAVFFGVLIVLALVLASSDVGMERFDVDFIEKFRRDIAEGTGSGVNLTFDMHTTSGFSLGTLVGAAHLLLAPFPWQLGGASLRMLLTTPELLYWWWLFFAGVVPGARVALRQRLVEMLPVLVFIVGLGLVYSMTFGNIGVVFRQRAQLLPWLFMLAAVGLEQRKVQHARRRARLLSYPAPARPAAAALPS